MKPPTKRQVEIMDLLSKGVTRKETAHMLGISEKTVAVHLDNLYRNLRAHSSLQALRLLIERGHIILSTPLNDVSEDVSHRIEVIERTVEEKKQTGFRFYNFNTQTATTLWGVTES